MQQPIHAKLKRDLIETFAVPVKVRLRRDGVLDVFLPKSVRLDPLKLRHARETIEHFTGRKDLFTPGRFARYHVSPIYEERESA